MHYDWITTGIENGGFVRAEPIDGKIVAMMFFDNRLKPIKGEPQFTLPSAFTSLNEALKEDAACEMAPPEELEPISWHYDIGNKEWTVKEDDPSGSSYCIKEEDGHWTFSRDTFHTISTFKSLNNAKLFALLYFKG